MLIFELCDGRGVEVSGNLPDVLGTLVTQNSITALISKVKLTVTSFLTQSSQNLVAENFFLVTAVFPSVMVTPMQT